MTSLKKRLQKEAFSEIDEAIERAEFFTDIFVNSGCLKEYSQEVKDARAFFSTYKQQLEKQGRTLRTLTKIKFINGRAIFPEQET